MLDTVDITVSALRIVVHKALKAYDDHQLLAWLEDDEPILKTSAARELHTRPNDRSFERICSLCQDKRHENREVAAFVLGQFGTPACPYAHKSFEILSNLLHDDYFEVQSAAISAIGQLATLGHQPPRKLQKRIVEFSDHPRPEIRQSVAYALLSIRNKLVDPALEHLLDDEHVDVRDAAEFSVQARRELQDASVPAK